MVELGIEKRMDMAVHHAAGVTRGRDEVYVAPVSLLATKGPAQLLISTAYSLSFWDLQHFMVIIKLSSPLPQVLSSRYTKLKDI